MGCRVGGAVKGKLHMSSPSSVTFLGKSNLRSAVNAPVLEGGEVDVVCKRRDRLELSLEDRSNVGR